MPQLQTASLNVRYINEDMLCDFLVHCGELRRLDFLLCTHGNSLTWPQPHNKCVTSTHTPTVDPVP